MQLELFQQMDQPMTTKELIEQYNIRVVHFFDKESPKGGCTVAYSPERFDDTGYPTGKFARVSVAWCNPNDMYSRKIGEEIAVDLLLSGDSVLMPIYAEGHPVRCLREIFDNTLRYHVYAW